MKLMKLTRDQVIEYLSKLSPKELYDLRMSLLDRWGMYCDPIPAAPIGGAFMFPLPKDL